ncbi:MAG: DNA replication and repair protein RecF [Caldisericia bacterium]|jgi:DNA replication and repair protein RecF|nr:DNA replication and repair protein RecF [Caldisericia bacterium]
MIIKEISILTFRNFDEFFLKFNDKLNLIIGKNGSGKTNLLNAIYYLSSGNTFNNLKENELPKFPETSFFLSGIFYEDDSKIKVEIIYKDKKKLISINGKPIQSQKELIGVIPVIFFNFRTKDIILKEPELRRNFLDTNISMIDKEYKYLISEYTDILQSKNSILKKLKEDKENFYFEILLESLNEKLYEIGIKIQEKRDNFIKRLKETFLNLYLKKVEIVYEPKIISLQELNKIKFEEIERGYGLIGPHLDDILFLYKGIDIKNLFSLGEIEEVSLYLILSLYNIVLETLKKEAIILIDDLFETIDKSKIENLGELLYNFNQVIITSFSKEIIPVELIDKSSTFFLKSLGDKE